MEDPDDWCAEVICPYQVDGRDPMTGLPVSHSQHYPCTVVFEDGTLGPCEYLYLSDLLGLDDLVSDEGRYPADWPTEGMVRVRLVTSGQGEGFEAYLVWVQ